jgi:hypothetical protein
MIGAVKIKGRVPGRYVNFKKSCFWPNAAKKIAAGIKNQQKFPTVSKILSVNKIGSVKSIDPCALKFL